MYAHSLKRSAPAELKLKQGQCKKKSGKKQEKMYIYKYSLISYRPLSPEIASRPKSAFNNNYFTPAKHPLKIFHTIITITSSVHPWRTLAKRWRHLSGTWEYAGGTGNFKPSQNPKLPNLNPNCAFIINIVLWVHLRVAGALRVKAVTPSFSCEPSRHAHDYGCMQGCHTWTKNLRSLKSIYKFSIHSRICT